MHHLEVFQGHQETKSTFTPKYLRLHQSISKQIEIPVRTVIQLATWKDINYITLSQSEEAKPKANKVDLPAGLAGLDRTTPFVHFLQSGFRSVFFVLFFLSPSLKHIFVTLTAILAFRVNLTMKAVPFPCFFPSFLLV